jgi:alpha-glucosidase
MANVDVPPGRELDPLAARLPGLGRDPARTPMQWDASLNAGFTSGAPWLPLEDEHRERNVALQRDDPTSMLSLTRALLTLRRGSRALPLGDYRGLAAKGDVLAFERRYASERWVVVLNLGGDEQRLDLPAELRGLEVALSTHLDREAERVEGSVALRGDEGVVLRPRA